MPNKTCMVICNEWDVIETRRMGRIMLQKIGFSIVDQARIITAISELARNIFLYTDKGEICMIEINHLSKKGICIIAKDQGPGIYDLVKVLEDGYSTGEGLGVGLPGVKRLMDEFDLTTRPDGGTRVKVIKWVT